MKAINFHWRLPHGGERANYTRAQGVDTLASALPEIDMQTSFCKEAEKYGFKGLLVDINYAKPDPVLLALALGMHTSKIEFIVACRSGLIPPTTYVQQLNTLSSLINGRFSLNVVAGHSPAEQRFYGDFLDHDERYARTDEFLALCRAFWETQQPIDFSGNYFTVEQAEIRTPFVAAKRSHPYLFVAGGSQQSKELAIAQGSCWMRLADTPEAVRKSAEPVRQAGKDVGLRLGVICRPTREEAVKAAYDLIAGVDPARVDRKQEKDFMRKSDSVSINTTYKLSDNEWLKPWLWTGAVRTHGAPCISLIGSPEEVAEGILEFKAAGVTEFILHGWPKLEELRIFGSEVIPLVRQKERESSKARHLDIAHP